MNHRPYALLAEITYRCPLHCPYCSNPARYPDGLELTTAEWRRVIDEAAALGVLQAGFSGGEPLLRPDLADLVAHARAAGLYTNLITSGLGLGIKRARELRDAGLDSVQISFQAGDAALADAIAGARAHDKKIEAAHTAREAGFALSANVVLHRRNIDRLPEIVAFVASLGATRVELANVQYYGWAYLNRAHLLPTREQVLAARQSLAAEKIRRAEMEIFYVLPDYYEDRPKPCMNGWGRRYLTVNAVGDTLPCPTASSIPGLRFENVRARSLSWIWTESESFQQFRGEDWMREPCRSCPERGRDFGGCRCQAALLTGDAANTDPVCTLSPHRATVDAILHTTGASEPSVEWTPRQNPRFGVAFGQAG
ncbi:MAG: pyrroloquinoline quinone biosynthesis protein PqqE [Chthoniobacter sp.]